MIAAEYEPAQSSRRRAPRAPVSLHGEVDNARLVRAVCKVLDLSLHGCRLQTFSEIERGSTLRLTFPGLYPMTADVVWSSGFVLGCHFHRMLNRRQLDMLVSAGRSGH